MPLIFKFGGYYAGVELCELGSGDKADCNFLVVVVSLGNEDAFDRSFLFIVYE